jgi:signal transduction histidine kinase
MQPEEIESVFGNKEVAQAVKRLETLHSQVDAEFAVLQKQLRDVYEEDDREPLQEKISELPELSQKLLSEIRALQRQFPLDRQKGKCK